MNPPIDHKKLRTFENLLKLHQLKEEKSIKGKILSFFRELTYKRELLVEGIEAYFKYTQKELDDEIKELEKELI